MGDQLQMELNNSNIQQIVTKMSPTEIESSETKYILEAADNPTEKLLQQFLKFHHKDNLNFFPPRSQTFPLDLPQKEVFRYKSDGASPTKESLSPIITELAEENSDSTEVTPVITDLADESDKKMIESEEALAKENLKEDIVIDDYSPESPQVEDSKVEIPEQIVDSTKKKGFWSRFKNGLTRSFRSKKAKETVVDFEPSTNEISQKESEKKDLSNNETEKQTEVELPVDINKDLECKKSKGSKVARLFRRISLRKHSKKSDSEVSSPESELSPRTIETDNQPISPFPHPTTLPQALFNISNPYDKNRHYDSSKRLPSATTPDVLDNDVTDEDSTIYYVAEKLFEMASANSPEIEKNGEFKSVEQQLAEYLRNCGDNFNDENKAMIKSMFVKVLDTGLPDSEPTTKIARLFLFSTETAGLISASQTLASLLFKSTAEFVEDQFAYLLTGKEGWGTVMKETSEAEVH